ncbi:hypothetical protein [Endozoicomonas sp.]|uniref:hypothetical protein n=1 Tax=Endozoicomonas sp. TaxID=1892382 RepID=UPI003AF677EA
MGMKTVTSQQQVIKNIQQFNKEANSFLNGADISENVETLVRNIPHYRAWYCFIDQDSGDYLFAPSKYIGYADINAASYHEFNQNGLDGRQTESVLSTWYKTIDESDSHEMYQDLCEKLREFCSIFGKKPNSLFRINIPFEKSLDVSLENDVVNFIWKAFQNLSPDSRQQLRNKITRYRD